MRSSFRLLLFFSPFLIAGVLYAIFQATDPLTIGPGGVLGVFILLYLECLSIVFILLVFGRSWLRRLVVTGKSGAKYRAHIANPRKSYYIASIIAFVPIVLLAVHSFSKVQLTDVLLVTLLVGISIFYVLKSR